MPNDDAQATADRVTDETSIDVETTETPDDPPLGPNGEKALAAERENRRAEQAKRRAAEAELRELRAKMDAKPDDEPDLGALRAQIEAEAAAKVAERVIALELKAAAAGKLADPADAHRFIDLSNFEVGPDGTVDSQDVADAIAGLLDSKPYLAARRGNERPGSSDAGVRQENRPTQLTREQVKAMGNDSDAILRAKSEGRLNQILGIHN